MKNLEKDLYAKRQAFGKNFTYSILGIFLFYIVLLILLRYMKIYIPKHLPVSTLALSFIAVAYIGYLLSKTTFSFQTIYIIVSVSFLCLIFYYSLLLCHLFDAIYYFYIPLLLLILIYSNLKTTAVSGFGIFILCVYTQSLSEYFNMSSANRIIENQKIIVYIEWSEILAVSYLSFFLLYYYSEFKKLETKMRILVLEEEKIQKEDIKESLNHESDPTSVIQTASDDKLFLLYNRILECMENEKPYQNPDFNLKILAEHLDSNTTYVSKALNIFGKKKFSQLTNEYKVKQVQEEIIHNYHYKFTIEYIYLRAGFTQQSTFNRIFKEQTGKTPSEFIETCNAKRNTK